jgi:hypothetical protein
MSRNLFLFSLLLFVGVKINLHAQCISYANNLSTKYTYSNISDPIKFKNGDYIVAYWSEDSCALNSVKLNSTITANRNSCFLLKFNSEGQIKQQVQLNIPIPMQSVKISTDDAGNVYFPIVVFSNATYQLSSKVTIAAKSYSRIIVVKISNDFGEINYYEIGKTANGVVLNPKNIEFLRSKQGIFLTASINSEITLNSSVKMPNNHPYSLYLLKLDTSFNVINFNLLGYSNNEILNFKIEDNNGQIISIIQYTDTINLPSLKKQQIAIIKSVLKLPSPYSGTDYLMLKISGFNFTDAFNIGCYGPVYLNNLGKILYNNNGNYVVSLFNSSTGILDNSNKLLNCKTMESRAIVTFDSLFNGLKYSALESSAVGGFTYSKLMADDTNKLYVTIGTNKWFDFDSNRVSLADTFKSTLFTTKLYSYSNMNYKVEFELANSNFNFLATNFNSGNMFCYLYSMKANPTESVWSLKLNKSMFTYNFWIANVCKENLSTFQFSKLQEGGLKISPNPVVAGGELNLEFNQALNSGNEISIFDLTGKQIEKIKGETNQTQFTTRIQVPGIYIVKPSGNIQSKKIVVVDGAK